MQPNFLSRHMDDTEAAWKRLTDDAAKARFFFSMDAKERIDFAETHMDVFPLLIKYVTNSSSADIDTHEGQVVFCLNSSKQNLDASFGRPTISMLNAFEPNKMITDILKTRRYLLLGALFERLSPATATTELFVGQNSSLFTKLVKLLPDARVRRALSTILKHISAAPGGVSKWHGSACSNDSEAIDFYARFSKVSPSLDRRYRKLAGLETNDETTLNFGDDMEIDEVLQKNNKGDWVFYHTVALELQRSRLCLKALIAKELLLVLKYVYEMNDSGRGVAIAINDDPDHLVYYPLMRLVLSKYTSYHSGTLLRYMTTPFLRGFFNWLCLPEQVGTLRETLLPVLGSDEKHSFFEALMRVAKTKNPHDDATPFSPFDFLCAAQCYAEAQFIYVNRGKELGADPHKPPVNSMLLDHIVKTLSSLKKRFLPDEILKTHHIHKVFVRGYLLLSKGVPDSYQAMLDAGLNHSPLFAIILWEYATPGEMNGLMNWVKSQDQGYEKALLAFQYYTSYEDFLINMPVDYRLNLPDLTFFELIKSFNAVLMEVRDPEKRRSIENALICIISHLPDNALLYLILISCGNHLPSHFSTEFVFLVSFKYIFSDERSVEFQLRAASITIPRILHNDYYLSLLLSCLKQSMGKAPELYPLIDSLMKEHQIAKKLVESEKFDVAKKFSELNPDLFKTDNVFSPEYHIHIMLEARERKPTRVPFLPSVPKSSSPVQTDKPSAIPGSTPI